MLYFHLFFFKYFHIREKTTKCNLIPIPLFNYQPFLFSSSFIVQIIVVKGVRKQEIMLFLGKRQKSF